MKKPNGTLFDGAQLQLRSVYRDHPLLAVVADVVPNTPELITRLGRTR